MDFPSFLETTISGAAFGFTAVLLAHPFDTVKTRQQVWSGTLRNKNLFNSLKPASFKGLYQGFGPALGGSILFRSVPFTAYGFSTNFLKNNSYTGDMFRSHPIVLAATGGVFGGCCRSLLECPLEVWKIRQQLQSTMVWADTYRGVGLTALRNALGVSMFFAFVAATEDLREQISGGSRQWSNFLAGGFCSTAAWVVLFPVDTIKSRVQSTGTVVWGRGLYQGLAAGLMRSFVANGCALVVYDHVKMSFQESETTD